MANTTNLETAINSLSSRFIDGVMKMVQGYEDINDVRRDIKGYFREIRCNLDGTVLIDEKSGARKRGELSDSSNFGNGHELMSTIELQKLIDYTLTLRDYSKRYPNLKEGHKDVIRTELSENLDNLENYFKRILEVPARLATEAGRESTAGKTATWYRSKMIDDIQAIKDALKGPKVEPMSIDNEGLFDLQDQEKIVEEKRYSISKRDIRQLENQYLEFALTARRAIYSRADTMKKPSAKTYEYFDPILAKNNSMYMDIKDSKSVSQVVLERPESTVHLLDSILSQVPDDFKGNEKNVRYEIGGRERTEPFLPGILKEMRKQMYMDLVLMGEDYKKPENSEAKRILSTIAAIEDKYRSIIEK